MKRDHEGSDQSENEEDNHKKVKGLRLRPKKGDYRMRAHINPLNSTTFPYPYHHSYTDWAKHFPKFFKESDEQNHKVTCNTVEHPSNYDQPTPYKLEESQHVRIIDIGCGFGGLLFGLSPLFPDKLILGMEIRDKLCNFVAEKIRGHRIEKPGEFNNIGVVRTNTMRHLCQYFPRASLEKIFICFADPHFKAKNHRRRIINTGYLSEYAYLLKEGGRLYCITDVQELHQWNVQHLRAHSMFEEENHPEDPCVLLMRSKTEEGQKVERNAGNKYWAVFRRKT